MISFYPPFIYCRSHGNDRPGRFIGCEKEAASQILDLCVSAHISVNNTRLSWHYGTIASFRNHHVAGVSDIWRSTHGRVLCTRPCRAVPAVGCLTCRVVVVRVWLSIAESRM